MNAGLEELQEKSVTLKCYIEKNNINCFSFNNLKEDTIKQLVFSAARLGDQILVEYILTNLRFEEGSETINICLAKACLGGYTEIVEYLLMSNNLKHHADIDANIDYVYKDSIINLAVKSNNLELVKFLLENKELKSNAKLIPEKWTLSRASESGKTEIIEYLLAVEQNNMPVLSIHENNDCALRTACLNGHIDLVRFILSKVDIEQFSKDTYHQILINTFFSGNTELFEYVFSMQPIKDYFLGSEMKSIADYCKEKYKDMLKKIIFSKKIEEQVEGLNINIVKKICYYAKNDLINTIVYDWKVPYNIVKETVKDKPLLQFEFEKRDLKNKLNQSLEEKNKKSCNKKV